MIEIRNAAPEYAEACAALAVKEYAVERAQCPQLPPLGARETLTGLIAGLARDGRGKVALRDGQALGYLLFAGPWDGHFGNARGVFSPLGASAFAGEERGKLASRLFESVAGELVEEGVSSFALSRYAHDRETGEAFVLNGFGVRCSDAVMRLGDEPPADAQEGGLEITEVKSEARGELDSLRRGLTRHLAAAPTFFPTDLRRFDAWWTGRDDLRVFAARDGGRVIGYMALCDDGETFVSEYERMRNICGAYVEEAYRGGGVAMRLLDHIVRRCRADGDGWLGVDCETLNPTALRFWKKRFDNYTYSYARRVDERVIGYRAYLNSVWG